MSVPCEYFVMLVPWSYPKRFANSLGWSGQEGNTTGTYWVPRLERKGTSHDIQPHIPGENTQDMPLLVAKSQYVVLVAETPKEMQERDSLFIKLLYNVNIFTYRHLPRGQESFRFDTAGQAASLPAQGKFHVSAPAKCQKRDPSSSLLFPLIPFDNQDKYAALSPRTMF